MTIANIDTLTYAVTEADICTNLAHLDLVQAIDADGVLTPLVSNRLTDAIYMYQAALRATLYSSSGVSRSDTKKRGSNIIDVGSIGTTKDAAYMISTVTSILECIAFAHFKTLLLKKLSAPYVRVSGMIPRIPWKQLGKQLCRLHLLRISNPTII